MMGRDEDEAEDTEERRGLRVMVTQESGEGALGGEGTGEEGSGVVVGEESRGGVVRIGEVGGGGEVEVTGRMDWDLDFVLGLGLRWLGRGRGFRFGLPRERVCGGEGLEILEVVVVVQLEV